MKTTITLPSEFNEITMDGHLSGCLNLYGENETNLDIHFEADSETCPKLTVKWVSFTLNNDLIDANHIEFLRPELDKLLEKNRNKIEGAIWNEWQQTEEYRDIDNYKPNPHTL